MIFVIYVALFIYLQSSEHHVESLSGAGIMKSYIFHDWRNI